MYAVNFMLRFQDHLTENSERNGLENFSDKVKQILESIDGLGLVDVYAMARSRSSWAVNQLKSSSRHHY